MDIDYTFFYVESNVFCQLVFLLLFLRNLNSVDRQMKQTIYDIVLVGHILYFASDILWMLVLSGYIPRTRFTVSTVNFTNAVFLLVIGLYWFMYIEISQGETYLGKRVNRILVQTPAVISFIIQLILFVFFNHMMVTPELEMTSLYSIIFVLIPSLYVFAAAIRSLFRAFRKENYMYRGTYIMSAFYPLSIVFFGILQVFWLTAPLFCFGCTFTMIYMSLVSQDELISLDPLTGLNNRGQLRKYISQEFSHSDNPSHYVVMIDLDGFKKINDQYGHLEGDKAIIRAANALKKACNNDKLRPFICRYGGDEFIIVMKTENENEVRELIAKINMELEKENNEADCGYRISASVGYAQCIGDPKTFQDAVERADQNLYNNKRNKYNY